MTLTVQAEIFEMKISHTLLGLPIPFLSDKQCTRKIRHSHNNKTLHVAINFNSTITNVHLCLPVSCLTKLMLESKHIGQ